MPVLQLQETRVQKACVDAVQDTCPENTCRLRRFAKSRFHSGGFRGWGSGFLASGKAMGREGKEGFEGASLPPSDPGQGGPSRPRSCRAPPAAVGRLLGDRDAGAQLRHGGVCECGAARATRAARAAAAERKEREPRQWRSDRRARCVGGPPGRGRAREGRAGSLVESLCLRKPGEPGLPVHGANWGSCLRPPLALLLLLPFPGLGAGVEGRRGEGWAGLEHHLRGGAVILADSHPS